MRYTVCRTLALLVLAGCAAGTGGEESSLAPDGVTNPTAPAGLAGSGSVDDPASTGQAGSGGLLPPPGASDPAAPGGEPIMPPGATDDLQPEAPPMNPDPDEARPLRILVTNDDGVAAEGIDLLVDALAADPDNEVVVCAPDGNRSGTGDLTGPSLRCGNLAVTAATTRSGYPSTAISGCPADAVNYALDAIYPTNDPPEVVISGINEGQNVSELVARHLSGTVGAARTAARRGVPALAVSQGIPASGGDYDYVSGVAAVLVWLDENRGALLAGGLPPTAADNLNVPSCSEGSIRGTISGLSLAASTTGLFDPQDCTSTLEDPRDDTEALLNGYIGLSAVPLD